MTTPTNAHHTPAASPNGLHRLTPATWRGIAAVGLLAGQVALAACGSGTNNPSPQLPLVTFTQTINLTNQEYTALRADNGAAYVAGGLKGLIVVRQNAGSYFAFERNCPYRPYDTCARVAIDASRLFLKDKCCSSQFDLQGRVQSGPANLPLRSYATSLSGNLLTITN